MQDKMLNSNNYVFVKTTVMKRKKIQGAANA